MKYEFRYDGEIVSLALTPSNALEEEMLSKVFPSKESVIDKQGKSFIISPEKVKNEQSG